ncbi:MAG: hypothetical protein IJR88_01900 [Clostridia bacterium]|nr:hypothetical protein [Clostridia bacterium]
MANCKNKSCDKKRYQAIFWGLVLILAAAVLILDGVGVALAPGFTPWRIIGRVLLLAWVVYEIVRLKFADIFFPLALLFLLFKDPLADLLSWNKEKIPKAWIILLAAILISIGLHIIFDRKKTVYVNGVKVENEKIGVGKMGKETFYADAADLSGYTIKDHLGAVELFVTNKESYVGSGVITICDNLGLVTLHLPGDWNVLTQCRDNLGTISVPEHEATGEKSITLDVYDNLGKVEVKFE